MSMVALSERHTPVAAFSPPSIVKRQTARWRGLQPGILRATSIRCLGQDPLVTAEIMRADTEQPRQLNVTTRV